MITLTVIFTYFEVGRKLQKKICKGDRKMNIKIYKKLNFNFPQLSNSLLKEAYRKAIVLELDDDFIELLKADLKNRDLWPVIYDRDQK